MASSELPVLHGDGIHDDTIALRAALAGEPFLVDGVIIPGTSSVSLIGGVYRITGPLKVTRPGTVIVGSKFHADPPADYAVLAIPGHLGSHVEKVTIRGGAVGIHLAA